MGPRGGADGAGLHTGALEMTARVSANGRVRVGVVGTGIYEVRHSHLTYSSQSLKISVFDQFINRLESGKGVSQKLVFPQTIELPPADCAILIGVLPELHQIGFELEPFGQQAFILRGIPAEIKESGADSIIESFLEQIKMNQTSLEDEKKSKMAKIMAKKASLKEGDRLHSDERQALIEQLFASSNPNYSPDGKKIIAMLGSDRLDELFM